MGQHSRPPVSTPMPARRLTCLAAVVLTAALLVVTPDAVRAQPNDDCLLATAIGALPFVDVVNTVGATAAVDDPVSICSGTENSVWYTYTAAANETLELDTIGSTYDTQLSVWDGACGALVAELGCDDDSGGGLDAKLHVPLRGGQSVLIMAATDSASGGTLTFNAAASPLAFAPAPTLDVVVSSSDLSPFGTAVGVLGSPALNKRNLVTFTGADEGIFLHDGAALSAIALSGDASPVGGTFHTFGHPAINDAGHVVFQARLQDSTIEQGLFLWDGAAITALVLQGDAEPAGGTFERFERAAAINTGDEVVFAARSSVDSNDRLYLHSGGVTTLLLTEGDASPCGGVIHRFSRTRPRGFDLNDLGQVAFCVEGRSGDPDGLYLVDIGSITAVACEGDAAPVGGTIDGIHQGCAINNLGDIVFGAKLSDPGFIDGVVLAAAGGGLSSVVAGLDVLVTGELVQQIPDALQPAINDAGDIAVSVQVAGGQCTVGSSVQLLVNSAAGGAGPEAVLPPGSACLAASTVVSTGVSLGITSSNEIVFESQCTDAQGAFLLAPGGAPVSRGIHSDLVAGGGFNLDQPDANATGMVVARGQRIVVYGVSCGGGGCGAPAVLAAPLDPIPGGAGQRIQTITQSSVRGFGKNTVFFAEVSGTSYQKGLFRVRGGTLATLVVSGTPAPGGGTIEHVGPAEPKFGGRGRPSISRRRVAFRGEIDPGAPPCDDGVFLVEPAGLVEIARSGGVSPLGGTYGLPSPPTLIGTRLVFNSEDSLFGECIFSATSAGVVSTVSCEGQAAPALVGGTLEQFETNATLSKRTPLFFVPLSGATVDECYLARTSSGLVPVACQEDPVPGGGTISRLGIGTADTPPYGAIRGPGSAFIVETNSDYSDTMLLAERRGVIWPVARAFVQAAPVSIGGTLEFDASVVSMNGRALVFNTRIDGGNAREAILRTTLR